MCGCGLLWIELAFVSGYSKTHRRTKAHSKEANVPTAKVRWKESEVSRLIRAHRKAGVNVCVEVAPNGSLVATPMETPHGSTSANTNMFDLEAERLRKQAAAS
jgi:hypothetical protein